MSGGSNRSPARHAFGFCDRTGFRYKLNDLVEEYVQGRPTGLRVGKDIADGDHPQNWVGLDGPYSDPHPLDNPRPDNAQEESRRLFSWFPAGVGNTKLDISIGQAVAS